MNTQTTHPTNSPAGANPKLIDTAAYVIAAAMAQGNREAYSLAFTLDAAGLLQSPETAAEYEAIAEQRLTEILARANAATPGPWEECPSYGKHFYAYLGGSYLRGVGTLEFGDGEDADADRAFTLHAREDIPTLVAEVVALRARVTEVETDNAELHALIARLGARAEQRHLMDPLDHVLEHLADAAEVTAL
ncbi:hypothetical protein [Streptomyces sp. NPDC056227]|uniref:hypothetical protein n=1 Tax=Streptomyces sp. NPDC056227 TaxID=3345753 RepID=UPI0035D7350A